MLPSVKQPAVWLLSSKGVGSPSNIVGPPVAKVPVNGVVVIPVVSMGRVPDVPTFKSRLI